VALSDVGRTSASSRKRPIHAQQRGRTKGTKRWILTTSLARRLNLSVVSVGLRPFKHRLFPPRARRFEEKPGAPLGFVDPDLKQAGAGHIAMLVANVVRLAQARHQLSVIVA
jgi:hypothetical protein